MKFSKIFDVGFDYDVFLRFFPLSNIETLLSNKKIICLTLMWSIWIQKTNVHFYLIWCCLIYCHQKVHHSKSLKIFPKLRLITNRKSKNNRKCWVFHKIFYFKIDFPLAFCCRPSLRDVWIISLTLEMIFLFIQFIKLLML